MKRSRIFNFLLILALLGIILIGPKFLQTNAAYIPVIGDNMGNHTATKNINLNGFWLSGNGGNNGIFIGANGNIGFGTDNVSGAKVTLVDHTTPAGGIKFGTNTNPDNSVGVVYTRTNNELTFPSVVASQYYVSNNSILSNTITANNGSETNPGITNNVHPTTGLSAIAGPNLLFLISGSEKMRLSHTGNVGIGTTDPQEKLAVNGSFHAQTICLDNGTDCLLIALNPAPPSCGTLSDQDGNTYRTVVIGDRCWMADNLNTGTMITGTPSPSNGVIEKWCYNNTASNCSAYGGLYRWDEAMQGSSAPGVRGICPVGWHLPTDAEWNQLELDILDMINSPNPQYPCTIPLANSHARCADAGNGDDGGEFGVGTSMTSEGRGDNLSGFNNLMVGYRSGTTSTNLGQNILFWTSTENSGNAWYRSYTLNKSTLSRFHGGKTSFGFSIRCIKNQ